MTEPDPVVVEAIAQLAQNLSQVDADTAWARLAHLTSMQRAQAERAVCGIAGRKLDGRARSDCSAT